MEIETNRLIIRDVRSEDAEPFAAMAADGSLNDIGFDKDCGAWMTDWVTEAKDLAAKDNPGSEYLAYTITLKSGNTVIGSVGCSYYEDLQQTGITYFIGAQHRNKGYAAEAVKAYSEYFLSRYPVPELIATVREENTASWKVIEKAGYQLTERRMYQDVNDDKAERYRFYRKSADKPERQCDKPENRTENDGQCPERGRTAKYTIYRHIGNLSQPNNGWTKELNYISWDDREPVYDIRTWNAAHTEYGKGVTVTAGQMAALKELLNEMKIF